MESMDMEHLDDIQIKSEIDDISKRIQSIMQTIKEFEPDAEGRDVAETRDSETGI